MGRSPTLVAAVLILALASVGLSSCATTPASHPAAPSAPLYRPPPQPPVDVGEQQPVLVGSVIKVTDGDTITVQLSSGPISVRFHSIDAPEKDQPWGQEARAALAGRLDGRQVALQVETQDRYERLVADVYLGDENINGWMVQQGHAWAYRDYLKDQNYCAWEGVARASRRGLWGLPPGNQYAPWEWRALKRGNAGGLTDYSNETVANCVAAMHRPVRSAAPAMPVPSGPSTATPPGGCRIKGNISQNGRIYHVPGSPSYDQTKIDTSKGERWFCSEAEARAAGWRPPR
jgi:endonuclease YncB( thermonuclease family)